MKNVLTKKDFLISFLLFFSSIQSMDSHTSYRDFTLSVIKELKPSKKIKVLIHTEKMSESLGKAFPDNSISLSEELFTTFSNNPSAIRFVIGHEVEHIEKSHCSKRNLLSCLFLSLMPSSVCIASHSLLIPSYKIPYILSITVISGLLLLLYFIRSQEKEADLGALKNLGKIYGYSTIAKGAITILQWPDADRQMLKYIPSLLLTHPSDASQIEYLEKEALSLQENKIKSDSIIELIKWLNPEKKTNSLFLKTINIE